ncbi:MAG: hypothetical protein A3G34_08230 [Candidatus Lindowbacteria bacterium RIFCSPLOWO2_12_FULL_62_27]|nr:MAG: hypothetical protein A3I06_04820 [Candidatus Lindowbacteria bacterium RIFCSPLOWO2_02_FULL_62_12]OGH58447.1 MAG: hypothetical protein A3G34_08230 [Candidatus Lindowbacteria bacterium RIFCSPLOWO2_12_FULL_62_27]
MQRDIYRELVEWRKSRRRKPLIMKGARQVGKTWILKEFGGKEYRNLVYLNFEEDSQLKGFFRDSKDPGRILKNLSIYKKQEINPETTLILFDEIQECNSALTGLKYFHEKSNQYHIVAAGSLLGVKTSQPGGFPVGQVNFLHMHPLTFMEFLGAVGEPGLRTLIEETSDFTPYPEPLHHKLIDLLRAYLFVGGMPEAVAVYADSGDLNEVRKVHTEINNSYVLDFAKHAPAVDIPKLTLIWSSIPAHLGKENKKFMFSALKKSARAREYEAAIVWLEDAGLIHRSHAVSAGKLPLGAYRQSGIYKVYALDTGLLGALANLPAEVVVRTDEMFHEYKGAMTENYVAQQWSARGAGDLYYWSSPGAAELDFICEFKGAVHPLEVKSGFNPRSKSLKFYDRKYNPKTLCRTNLLNLKADGKIRNYPLYAVCRFPE